MGNGLKKDIITTSTLPRSSKKHHDENLSGSLFGQQQIQPFNNVVAQQAEVPTSLKRT